MNRKQLPMHEPIIATYTSYGAIFSMIGDSCKEWLYNNFIQIRFASGWGILTFDKHQYLMSNCPGLNFYAMPREVLEERYDNSLFSFIKSAIDLNFYVFLFVDRYYIPINDNYKKEHASHELFITGYDLDDNTVIVSDNIMDGKFNTMKCKIEELEEAYAKMDIEYTFLSELRMVRVVPDGGEPFRIRQVKFELERYLYSMPAYDLVYTQDYIFGFEVCEFILKAMEEWNAKKEHYDKRIFHLLYEHKIIMEERVDYMEKNHYIPQNSGLLEEATALKKEFLLIRNSVVKRSVMLHTGKGNVESLTQSLTEKVKETFKREKKFIKDLIDQIIIE